MNDVNNFARFYKAFNALPYMGDKNELKESLVSEVTAGRTTSLREVTRREYDALCKSIEETLPKDPAKELYLKERRRLRSACLKQMQKIGIDTTDWGKVDAFCLKPTIRGKRFSDLDLDELRLFNRQLRAISETTNKQ